MITLLPFQPTKRTVPSAISRVLEGDILDGDYSKTECEDLVPLSFTHEMVYPQLPEDILITIFQYLSLPDVHSIRRVGATNIPDQLCSDDIIRLQVCKSFAEMTRSRGLWILLLRREICNRNIPTPTLDLEHLTAAQIERYVVRSLRLHRNWTSSSPTVKRQRIVTVGTPSARITSLHFITREGCSYLLSFSLTSRVEPRTLTVECWELKTLRCKARRTVPWFGGYAVNSDHQSNGLLAIKSPHIEVLALDPSATNPDSAFITLITLGTAAKRILSLSGTTMIFRTPNNELKVLDIIRPLIELKLEDIQPAIPQNQPDSFEAIVHDDVVVIIRPKTLALYLLGSFRNGSHPAGVPLSPVRLHEFQWRIDSCQMERTISPSSGNSSDAYRPSGINILIRYSSLFPWPVNLLHHYILCPNQSYVPSSTRSHSTTTDFGINSNNHNLPYNFPPVLSQTIVSPVRLFAITDMALGPYGTAIWLDSHTEDFYYHGEVGQRLAGLMLNLSPQDEGEQVGGSGEGVAADQNTQTAASMVFGAHEADDWNRVAVDEGEGRIAVGSVTGEIMIKEYAEG